ncbi:hypothetical protein DASB73_032630 [Starmerella bacillaris]|uniref:Uncharacterized protein n=1 Tax=Starmerella bacillaris TaxID=1247836 RepID=A0AAV5RL74_STABA|nr:hypothetical protein DASB73_032630 [Starmerella bacillaris]
MVSIASLFAFTLAGFSRAGAPMPTHTAATPGLVKRDYVLVPYTTIYWTSTVEYTNLYTDYVAKTATFTESFTSDYVFSDELVINWSDFNN